MSLGHQVSFVDGPFPYENLRGAAAVDAILKLKPNVWCIFVRKQNGNLALHEALLNSNGHIVGHDSYWLDLEPTYKASAREQGRMHDRDEFTQWDRLGYGFHVETSEERSKSQTVRLAQHKQRAVVVKAEGKRGVNAYVKINDEVCRLRYIYVENNGNLVSHIVLHGINHKRQLVSERLSNVLF